MDALLNKNHPNQLLEILHNARINKHQDLHILSNKIQTPKWISDNIHKMYITNKILQARKRYVAKCKLNFIAKNSFYTQSD